MPSPCRKPLPRNNPGPARSLRPPPPSFPRRDSNVSASETRCAVGRGGGRQAAQFPRDFDLGLGRQGAKRDESRRRRPADPGVAMNDQRTGAIPVVEKGEQAFDLALLRQHMAVKRRDDVGQAERQMTLGRNGLGPRHRVAGTEQRHQGAGAADGDDLVDLAERADIDSRHLKPLLDRFGIFRGTAPAPVPAAWARARFSTRRSSISGAPNRASASSPVESGVKRRLEKGRDAIGLLGHARERRRRIGRERKTQQDGAGQPILDLAINVAERRLERRDHVADDIFRRVMQQGEQPPARRRGRIEQAADLARPEPNAAPPKN